MLDLIKDVVWLGLVLASWGLVNMGHWTDWFKARRRAVKAEKCVNGTRSVLDNVEAVADGLFLQICISIPTHLVLFTLTSFWFKTTVLLLDNLIHNYILSAMCIVHSTVCIVLYTPPDIHSTMSMSFCVVCPSIFMSHRVYCTLCRVLIHSAVCTFLHVYVPPPCVLYTPPSVQTSTLEIWYSIFLNGEKKKQTEWAKTLESRAVF